MVGFEQYSDVCETPIQAIGNSFYFGVDLVVFGGLWRIWWDVCWIIWWVLNSLRATDSTVHKQFLL